MLHPATKVLDSTDWSDLEGLIQRFEDSWRDGARPDISAFLPEPGPPRHAALVELVHADLECRLKAGDAARVEDYLERYPEVRGDRERVVELLVAEYTLRQQRGDTAAVEEYVARFPAAAEEVQRRLRGAPPAPLPAALPGYEILEELGRGGMGVVYRALQLSLGRPVALKVIQVGSHAGRQQRARFQREAEVIARLRHPGIVQIHEIGSHEGLPFLALEYVAGGGLDRRLAGTPQPPAQAAAFIAQLAAGVQFAHERGIIHRDLKPSNVLLQAADGSLESAQPKIADFGLAKCLESGSHETHTGQVLGTPSYMAPEQAAGQTRDIGPATDVWALGAIFYEMLTGRPPFRAASVLETLDQVAHEDSVPPRQLQPRVPRDLETICLKCLEKEPQRRYASAGDLAEDLRRFASGYPVLARPAGVLVRTGKWVRRRPALATVVGFGLCAVAALIAASAYLQTALRQRTEELRAEQQQREQEAAAGETARARQAHALQQQIRQNLYFSDVRLAYQHWQAGDLEQAHLLLQQHMPQAGEPERRGFEWDYLARRCALKPRVLLSPSDYLSSACFAPDGKSLAVVGQLGAEILDASSWQPRFAAKATVRMRGVAVSPDGTTIACARDDRVAQLIDVATGQPRAEFACGQGSLYAVAFSPDGARLATAGDGNRVKLWDLGRNAECGLLDEHTSSVMALAYSPDGRTLASAGFEGLLVLWDLATGKPRVRITTPLPLLCVAYAPDGHTVAAADAGGTVNLWDAASGRSLGALHGHRGAIFAVAFAPDNRSLASGGADTTVRLWDLATRKLESVLRGHSRVVLALAFAPGGQMLVSCGEERNLRVWDLEAQRGYRQLEAPLPAAEQVAYAPDGQSLAFVGRDSGVRILDAATGAERMRLRGNLGAIHAIAFSDDGRLFAGAGEDRSIHVWEVTTGRRSALLQGHGDTITSLCFAPTGTRIASASRDGAAILWEAAAGTLLHRLTGHAGEVSCIRFAPDGNTIASAGADETVHLWDAARGTPLLRLTYNDPVRTVLFTQDGSGVIAGTTNELLLRSCADGKPLGAFKGHISPLLSLQRAPDGKTIASVDASNTLKFWDPVSRLPRAFLDRRVEPVCAMAFAPDGHTMAVVTTTGGVSFWDTSLRSVRRLPGQLPAALDFLHAAAAHDLVFGQAATPALVRHFLPFGLEGCWDEVVPASTDDSLRRWPWRSPGAMTFLPHRQPVRILCTALSPDGRTLAAAGEGGAISLLDTQTAQPRRPLLFVSARAASDWQTFGQLQHLPLPELFTHPATSHEVVGAMAFSPDGTLLATVHGSSERWGPDTGGAWQIKLWRMPEAVEVAAFAGVDDGHRVRIAFAPDGKSIAVSIGNQLRHWDLASRTCLRRWSRSGDIIRSLAFSPDERTIAAGTNDWCVCLHDIERDRTITLTGHTGPVDALAFAPRGTTLASGSDDGTIKLWSSAGAQVLATLEGHRGRVSNVAFLPDGATLLSSASQPHRPAEVFAWHAAAD